MNTLIDRDVDLGSLLLDPNNYRFQDSTNFVAASDERFHEDSVQKRALDRLRSSGLTELKNSILTNGFLPFERIIVRPYGDAGDAGEYFLVIEGNRRVATLKWIAEDYQAGVNVPDSVKAVLEQVPVTVVEPGENGIDESLVLSLMGVRHVGGIKEWGGYQRAKLVTELRDTHALDTGEIASRLGMTAHEVNRRYRAFKALQQMAADDEYGDQAVPDMYALFHEAVLGTAIKDWLGWDDDLVAFTNAEALHTFYSLITNGEDEEGAATSPKLANRESVRDMREVLAVPDALRALLDGDRSFADALAIAKAENLSRTWVAQVGEAIAALTGVGALELQALSPDDVLEIERLRDTAARLLELHARLQD